MHMASAKMQENLDKTMACIRKFVAEHNYSPSVRDICQAGGFKSTASVQYYLEKLVAAGLIRRETSKNRTIELVESDEEFSDFASVPMLGNIAAGQPLLEAVENDVKLHFPADFFKLVGDNFCLTVKGESMREIGIMNGDIVLIHATPTASDGEIVAAQIDGGEVTLKRFFRRDNEIVLHPENSEMDDIIVPDDTGFRILGTAVGLMRNSFADR